MILAIRVERRSAASTRWEQSLWGRERVLAEMKQVVEQMRRNIEQRERNLNEMQEILDSQRRGDAAKQPR